MMQKKNKLLLWFCLYAGLGFAQNAERVFLMKDFFQMVIENHPIAKQAFLLNDVAKSELLMARGWLDPKFEFEITQKYLQDQTQSQNRESGTNYYTYLDNGLKIPLWFGPDIQFGFEDNTGKLVNPTSFTPPGGLAYAGLKIPLFQGMIIDERRAAIRQAKLMQNMADFERIKVINKVLYGAAKEYIDWIFFYKKFLFVKEAYQLAEIRYEGVRQRALNGDLSPIDTVEAQVLLQERFFDLQNAENDLQNSQVAVSTYLWTPQNEPLELEPQLIPEEDTLALRLNQAQVNDIIKVQFNQHPELLKLDNKIRQYQIDFKLARDKLLPNLDLDYKYLTANYSNFVGDFSSNYFVNNYKIGVTLNQPIFLRKERAKIQLAKIKMSQTQLERSLAARQIQNNMVQVANDLSTYDDQRKIQSTMLGNVRKLRDAEIEKFNLGESSIFLVNSRESKLLDAQIKFADVRRKLQKTQFEFLYEAGTNGLQWNK